MKTSTKRTILAAAISSACLLTAMPSYAEGSFTANASATSNYIWRGLTQTTNEAAVQGGIDYAHESGFYAGTWASNVTTVQATCIHTSTTYILVFQAKLKALRTTSVIFTTTTTTKRTLICRSLWLCRYGWVKPYCIPFAHTEADEGEGQDFGLAQASYTSLGYTTEILNGTELGFHVGYHEGDFRLKRSTALKATWTMVFQSQKTALASQSRVLTLMIWAVTTSLITMQLNLL